jgi:hypothetical protein
MVRLSTRIPREKETRGNVTFFLVRAFFWCVRLDASAHAFFPHGFAANGWHQKLVSACYFCQPRVLYRKAFIMALSGIYSRLIPAGWTLTLPPSTLLEGGNACASRTPFLGLVSLLEA